LLPQFGQHCGGCILRSPAEAKYSSGLPAKGARICTGRNIRDPEAFFNPSFTCREAISVSSDEMNQDAALYETEEAHLVAPGSVNLP
jgi:hypothetical protein